MSIAPHFDPNQQIAAAYEELGAELESAIATFGRIGRLKDKLVAEVEAIRAERDQLEIYTEEEAAKLLRLETTRQLADLRRRLKLPHAALGMYVRYTRQHLDEIITILTVRKQPNKAALKRAA